MFFQTRNRRIVNKTEDRMTKYIKREMADMNGKGTTQAHYRVKTFGCRTFREFAEQCANGSTVTVSDVVAVVSRIASELAWQIGQGYSVTIDGLGTFSGRLGVTADKPLDNFDSDTEHRNAMSLGFTGVNFRVDKALVGEINAKCFNLERSGECRLRRSPYTPEQRAERARQWLREHTMMHVADYAALNGLSRTTASLELRRLDDDPSSGIVSHGGSSAKVYMLGE